MMLVFGGLLDVIPQQVHGLMKALPNAHKSDLRTKNDPIN